MSSSHQSTPAAHCHCLCPVAARGQLACPSQLAARDLLLLPTTKAAASPLSTLTHTLPRAFVIN